VGNGQSVSIMVIAIALPHQVLIRPATTVALATPSYERDIDLAQRQKIEGQNRQAAARNGPQGQGFPARIA
jgi:hypothetical protein